MPVTKVVKNAKTFKTDGEVLKKVNAFTIRHERHGLGRGTIRIARAALDEYRRDAAGAVRRPSSSSTLPSGSTQARGRLGPW